MFVQYIDMNSINISKQECVLSPKSASVYDILENYSDNSYVYNAEEIRN